MVGSGPFGDGEIAAECFFDAFAVAAEGGGYADVVCVGDGWGGDVQADCFP